MTTKEFSDAFDTLIAAYNHKSEFGDLTSLADVTLDEYEKSVFLTLALDLIVKNYFSNRTNSVGEGFDDSIRRQADFSSLITTYNCEIEADSTSEWSKDIKSLSTGNLSFKGRDTLYSKVILSFECVGTAPQNPVLITFERGIPTLHVSCVVTNAFDTNLNVAISSALQTLCGSNVSTSLTNPNANLYLGAFNNAQVVVGDIIGSEGITLMSTLTTTGSAYDERGRIFKLPAGLDKVNHTDPLVLLMLNERVTAFYNGVKHYLVVVPISYTEYDRLMSRAYAQPLKKQAWRLFEGDPDADATTRAEIIANEKYTLGEYIIRYVRRPRPIILTDLDLVDSQVPLEIDGENKVTECELNPILHMDILLEAVRLALGSKGIETADARRARQLAERAQRQS